jgi:biotin-dependent carboxylase-like uncharacterized protein
MTDRRASGASIEVISPGLLTTIQDDGRHGYAHLGVPPSGALDKAAFHLANRLVGNDVNAAVLEMTILGCTLRFNQISTVVLTGAHAQARLNGRDEAMNAPITVPAGGVLELGSIRQGARTYLAFRGGLDVPLVLGSRSTDTLTGLGPAPIRAGDALPLGTVVRPWPGVDVAAVPPFDAASPFRIIEGPRADWFTKRALAALVDRPYLVHPDSNRVALRLSGELLPRARATELASEGVLTGAIQVPMSLQPILFLNDHPTTGGYPVIAVLHSSDLDRVGQLRPGDTLRFQLQPETAGA